MAIGDLIPDKPIMHLPDMNFLTFKTKEFTSKFHLRTKLDELKTDSTEINCVKITVPCDRTEFNPIIGLFRETCESVIGDQELVMFDIEIERIDPFKTSLIKYLYKNCVLIKIDGGQIDSNELEIDFRFGSAEQLY